jgi:hypothetical protein
MPTVKQQAVEQFAGAIHAHQQEMVKQRKDVGDELVEHMLKLPGMAQIFDTEQDKQMLGQQLVNMVEMASRVKVERSLMPPPFGEPEPEQVTIDAGDQ